MSNMGTRIQVFHGSKRRPTLGAGSLTLQRLYLDLFPQGKLGQSSLSPSPGLFWTAGQELPPRFRSASVFSEAWQSPARWQGLVRSYGHLALHISGSKARDTGRTGSTAEGR